MGYNIENIAEVKTYLKVLKKHSPYNFCEYSHRSINRRINKVLETHSLSFDELIEKTRNDSLFVENIIQEITVNTTEFFRDPEVWKKLYNYHFPSLKNRETLNIWHAGCSSGQEVYSGNIILNELGLLEKSNILATDLNSKMLKTAEKGEYNYRYNSNAISNFNYVINKNDSKRKVLFGKYFEFSKDSDIINVNEILKSRVDLKRHDLVNGKLDNVQKFDVIFCRNVLIYFNAKLQTRILKYFHDNLNDGGMLILGVHEGLTGFFKTKFIADGPAFIKTNAFHFRH